MKLTADTCAPHQFQADLLAVVVAQEGWADALSALNAALGGSLIQLASGAGFEGRAGQTFKLYTLGQVPARQLLLVGVGNAPLSSDQLRDLGGNIARAASEPRAASLAVSAPWGSGPLGADAHRALRLIAEGVRLGAYRFDRYLSEKKEGPRLEAATFLTSVDNAHRPLELAGQIADGTSLARDMMNEPPNVCTPVWMAEQALAIAARHGLKAEILDVEALTAKGMNLLLAVGRGSVEPSRMIHLTWTPEGTITRRLAFVGKGVTFDTGGYSLKPAGSMMGMHCDMGGGAAVLGAAEVIGRLRPVGVEIHFIVPAATNRVSSNAYTVNEVIRGYNGKTVEINNTDAEGRLLLADALAWAVEMKVDAIVDLATLTGACVVALGEHHSGLFSNNEAFGESVRRAGAESGERLWPMPVDEKLRDKLKSPVADMRNTGDRWGGAITAALFLKEFIGDTPWVHLDIAGPAIVEAETPISLRGGSGVGVSTLVQLVLNG